MLRIAATIVLVSMAGVASAQSSTTKCSKDYWGNVTCKTEQDRQVNWDKLTNPAPAPIYVPPPRPQIVYVPQPTPQAAPAAPVAAASAMTQSQFQIGSVGWLKDLCRDGREACLTYLYGVIQVGYRNNELNLCPPAGITLGDYPKIILADLKNNLVLTDGVSSDMGVIVSLNTQLGCKPKPDAEQPTPPQK